MLTRAFHVKLLTKFVTPNADLVQRVKIGSAANIGLRKAQFVQLIHIPVS